MIVNILYLFLWGASVDPGPLVWPPGDMLAERRQGATVLRLQPLSVQAEEVVDIDAGEGVISLLDGVIEHVQDDCVRSSRLQGLHPGGV